MRVAVIGTGNIGSSVGAALARAGHDVVLGSRHPADVTAPDGTSVAGIADALSGSDAVLLAVPAAAVGEFLAEHTAALDGPLVVDATNDVRAPIANAYRALVAAVPSVRYARAFNSLGWENFAEPRYGDTEGDLFFSSSDADRGLVETLIEAVGLRPMYLGEGQQEVVDGVLRLWFALAVGQGRGRHLGFRVLT